MEFHCPKCGEVCKSLFFNFRGKIIFCNVCKDLITEFILEEDKNEKEKKRTAADGEQARAE